MCGGIKETINIVDVNKIKFLQSGWGCAKTISEINLFGGRS